MSRDAKAVWAIADVGEMLEERGFSYEEAEELLEQFPAGQIEEEMIAAGEDAVLDWIIGIEVKEEK